MNGYLNFLIDNVGRRYRSIRWAWILTASWIVLAAIGVSLSVTGELAKLTRTQRIALGCTSVFGALLVGRIASQRSFRDFRWIATQIEAKYPSLKQRLITAVQLQDKEGFFERSLVSETIKHARAHDWNKTIAGSRVVFAWFCQFVALIFSTWLVAYCMNVRLPESESMKAKPSLPIIGGSITVEPGDVEIERGLDVVVTIRFPGDVPAEAWLESSGDEESANRQSMNRSLKDPFFGAYIRNVREDLKYRIEYPGTQTKYYSIKTFDYPAITRCDATIESPAYANLETKTVQDTRRVTVVDGAKLTWSCYVNKPLVRASLIAENGEALEMRPSDDDPLRLDASFEMTESRRWKVHLVDNEQRAGKFDEDLSAKVLKNKEPEIKLANAGDLRVSPVQEFKIRATAQDDFGVKRSGVTLAVGDSEQLDLEIPGQPGKAGKMELEHTIDLESFQAKPDQLVSYFFWSEDQDRDGNPRRVDGEMFFAEVRPFEEIFRQGESMSQQQQQQQQQQQSSQGEQQAEELSELQKKIVAATWNVLRRETPKAISEAFTIDVETIADSQRDAFAKTDELKEKLEDEKSKDYLDQVRDSMQTAIEQLEMTTPTSDLFKLREALQSERKAYEGLLRLRSREHQVVQSQQQSRSSASRSASQRNRQEQLNQLKLEEDENRYESEERANAEENSAQRESRQVMNRLEELSRRQKDINQQVKDLETALREAKTEEKKEELEEQLQRLRENQEELLRDADELLERMNQPENRQAMEQAREQTEQTRSELSKAADALSKSDTAQSLTSGTRAERQLDETRERLRQESSNQFEQTMRDMLNDAKKIDSRQQQLREKIRPKDDGNPTSENSLAGGQSDDTASPLRPEGNQESTDSMREEWTTQKKELTELLQKVQETVTEAESSEPLLAEQLYETYRETKQTGVEQRMDQIPTMLDRGLEEPAVRAADEVASGIQKLRQGIEQASQGVLGSEEASLRRALSEVNRAQQQLEEELQSKDQSSRRGDTAEANSARQPSERTQGAQGTDKATEAESRDRGGNPEQSGQPQQQPTGEQSGTCSADEQRGGEPRAGEPQAGEPQAGEPQAGEPQAGEPRGEPGSRRPGGIERMAGAANGAGRGNRAPLTGDEYSQWMDSLRDVEELVNDPELRAEAARIREAARSMRVEYKRHAKEPQWALVRKLIANPLERLKEKVQEDLFRLSAEKNALVPVDRDPVPGVYQKQLDRYYENLGSGLERGNPAP